VSRAPWLGALGIVGLLHCSSPQTLPPLGQLVLYLDTDAPLPSGAAGVASALTPAPLFDRVRFDATPTGEAVDAAGCDCSRQFDVTEERVRKGEVSFGVLGSLAGHGTIRVRMFRGGATVQGEPDPRSTIDMTFALPSVPAEGIVSRTLFLPTENVGTPLGTTTPLETSPGPPDPYHVGTWPGAQRKNCPAAPHAGEVCVPGGAFWMGNVAAANGPGSGNVSRLIVMSPYYIDATETTVAAYRAAGGQDQAPWPGTDGCDLIDYCTYSSAPGKYDDLPINCIDWAEARMVCQSQGKDLPSEVQFEYVASELAGNDFVWGFDLPQCGDAVFERGGYGYYFSFPSDCVSPNGDTECCGSPLGGLGLGGPLPPNSSMRDMLTIALPGWTGTIYDLAGNLGEYARDQWDLETGPCWSKPGIYTDPVCMDPDSSQVVVRGGDWTAGPEGLLAAQRTPSILNAAGPQIGFRCVRATP
jgi:formylglycine-generating enzyme required for sulfatase activity